MARSMTTRSSAGFGRLWTQNGDDAGFSLVESLVAFTIFVTVSVSATFLLIKSMQLTTVTQGRVAASNIATQEIEDLRSAHMHPHAFDEGTHTVTLNNTSYTVDVLVNPSQASGSCARGQVRQVTVVVSWPTSDGTRTSRYDTEIAC